MEHTAGPEECGLFVAGEVGDAVKALLQVGVGGDVVGRLAVVEQWVRANEQHPETYVSRCCFLVGAGGLREPRRKGARVAAPSGCIVPWAARASCWPQPQQLLPVSAAGSGRRCCTGAFFPAGLFGGSYELRLPLFPQPLGRALKKRSAAPASPPCFRRRRRSAPLLFESTRSMSLALSQNKNLSALAYAEAFWWARVDSNHRS